MFHFVEVSYNQPRLLICSTWNPNGITFANRSVPEFWPKSLFVDRNNTVYVTDRKNGNVKEWRAGSSTVTGTTFHDLSYPVSLFVTADGTIYVDNGEEDKVEKWTLDATESAVAMTTDGPCSGLFVDIEDSLYCSLAYWDQVVKQWLDTEGMKLQTTVAGNNESCGPALDMLCDPRGIFVTTKLDLYVADCGNNRIQLFAPGELTGKTVVGDVKISSLRLNCPSGVVVDGDNYLFIVDAGNSRIIRSKSNGYDCVVGCSTRRGSASDQLDRPYTVAFENAGNILVTDDDNYRVQKFMLITNTDGR